MRRFYQRLSVWLGFLIFSVLLFANALILRKAVTGQIHNSQWMEHTNHVLLELEQVESLLLNAETGQRGYLYTGEKNYLEPFAASRGVDSHLDALESLVADNPDQSQPLRELRRLAHEKIQELSDTVELYQSGKASEARSVVISGHGKQIMDRVRIVIGEMQNRETALYAAREKQTNASQRRTLFSIYGLTLVSLVGLFILCAWILSDIRQRERHAAEIQEREQTLQLAAAAGDLGLWSWKVGSPELDATDRCKALFGLRPQDKFDYVTALALIHPEDREKTKLPFATRFRMARPTGLSIALSGQINRFTGFQLLDDAFMTATLLRSDSRELVSTSASVAPPKTQCAPAIASPLRPEWRMNWRIISITRLPSWRSLFTCSLTPGQGRICERLS